MADFGLVVNPFVHSFWSAPAPTCGSFNLAIRPCSDYVGPMTVTRPKAQRRRNPGNPSLSCGAGNDPFAVLPAGSVSSGRCRLGLRFACCSPLRLLPPLIMKMPSIHRRLQALAGAFVLL